MAEGYPVITLVNNCGLKSAIWVPGTLPGFLPDTGDGVAPGVAGLVFGLLEPPLQARAGVGGELRVAGQPSFELPAQLGVAGHHAARDGLELVANRSEEH